MAKSSSIVDPVTSITRELKKCLLGLGGAVEQNDVIKTDILKILQITGKDDKAFAHMQLMFHLPFKNELEAIFDDPLDFDFIIPGPLCNVTLSVELFAELVVKGDLINHFMQAAYVIHHKNFIQTLMSAIIDQLITSERCEDLTPFVIIMLVKILRDFHTEDDDDNVNMVYFSSQFKTLLTFIMESQILAKCEKLVLLLRIAGVACMQGSEYQDPGATATDLIDLIDEWNLDITSRISSDTKSYFMDLFKSEIKSSLVKMNSDILGSVEAAMEDLSVSEEDIQTWNQTKKTHRMNWLEFIGIYSYLTTSLLSKRQHYQLEDSIVPGGLLALSQFANKFSQYKPKLTKDDFLGEINDFKHFCTVMKRFGDKDRDRNELLPQFLEFSYNEIFMTKEGLKITDKYLVPGANFELGLKYIEKALDVNIMPENSSYLVPLMVKLVIIKLLTCNQEVKERRDEIISHIFKNGSHSQLSLKDFKMHLNDLCSKVGHIEKDAKNNAQVQQHNIDLVYSVCVQNPEEAIQNLMKTAIMSHHSKVLQIARPFLQLKHCGQILANICFERVIDQIDEQDQMFESLITSVPILIEKNILEAEDVLGILKKKIHNLFIFNTLNLKKISKLFLMMNELAILSQFGKLDRISCEELFLFALNVEKFTYKFVFPKTFREILIIRFLCKKIVSNLSQIVELKSTKYLEDLSEVKSLTLLEIGFAYINIPMIRSEIRSFIRDEKLLPGFSPPTFPDIQESLSQWVLNVDNDSYTIIIDFVIEITKSLNPNLTKIFNCSLLLAWDSCLSVASQPTFRQYLKFYQKSISELFAKNLIHGDDVESQREIVKALIHLIRTMHESMRRRKHPKDRSAIGMSIQQVMLVLLEEMNIIVAHNEDFEENLQSDVLDMIYLLPIIKECEPIRKCLIDRIVKHYNCNLMPLPKTKKDLGEDNDVGGEIHDESESVSKCG